MNNGENPIIEQFYPKWRNGNPMTTRSTLLMFLRCVFGLESYPKTIKALHGPCNMGTVEKGYRQFIWLFSNSEEFKIHSKFIAIFNLMIFRPVRHPVAINSVDSSWLKEVDLLEGDLKTSKYNSQLVIEDGQTEDVI